MIGINRLLARDHDNVLVLRLFLSMLNALAVAIT